MINKNKIPVEVLTVLNNLQNNNYESFLVGGCVRDLLLGRSPKDYDICTKATPEQVKGCFEKVVDTGIKFGTVTVLINDYSVEVTTYRKDGNYGDGRRPDKVEFGTGIREDLQRRDFTINAILYDGNKIIDWLGSDKDLRDKKIKAIGNSDERFQEDALRMLRAIRFSCQLGFRIDPKTLLSIKRNKKLIKNISAERIRDELSKILISNNPVHGIEMLEWMGLLDIILPELKKCVGFDQNNPHHNKNIFRHILKVLDSTPNNLIIRLAALLHDIAKPKTFTIGEDGIGHFYSHHLEGYGMSKEILSRLKFDNNTIDKVSILVKEHMSRYPKLRSSTVKKLINRVGIENIDNLINLQIADIIGSIPPYDFKNIIELKEEIKRILNEKEPMSVKDLVINGNDLISLGYKPGKEMGVILNKLLEKVLEEPEQNTRENLIYLALNSQ